MAEKSIARNQRVSVVKIERSREMRKNMTEAENVFWKMVRARKLSGLKFRRQQIIDGFIVDFYCDSLGLCVEIDGGVHDTEEKRVYDRLRSEALELRKMKVLRFRNEEVLNDIDSVKAKILGLI